MDQPKLNSIAFIPPRYGEEVVGGAEAVIAETAHGFAARGYDVEILTTCAKDHFTWANDYPEGNFKDGDVTVRRFKTQMDTAGTDRDTIGNRILDMQDVPIQDQQRWINDSLRSSELWHHVLKYGDSYRALIFAPYMFWTTFAVGQIYPHKTLLMPCLHDEPPAYLELFQPLFNGAGGIWFLSTPEAELANQIFDLPSRNEIVGAAIEIPLEYDAAAFKKKFAITKPYIYYAGRREWGKGWQNLMEAFKRVVVDNGMKDLLLVTSGVGDIVAPDAVKDSIIDVGFISDQDRNNAMAGAVAYVQPSSLESFSRTVLEAWLAGTPVIANADSEVVSWHIDRSQAGVYYRNLEELTNAILLLSSQPDLAANLAVPGREYVLMHYQPEHVLDNMQNTLEKWFPLDEDEVLLAAVPNSAGEVNVTDNNSAGLVSEISLDEEEYDKKVL